MTRVLLIPLAVLVAVGLAGCRGAGGNGLAGCLSGSCESFPEGCTTSCDAGCADGCDACGGRAGLQGLCGRGCGRGCAPAPAAAAVTYPYYTVRGPRDFLAQQPRSIGP